eukprot:4092993-Amphidinium_carterae.1
MSSAQIKRNALGAGGLPPSLLHFGIKTKICFNIWGDRDSKMSSSWHHGKVHKLITEQNQHIN